MKKTLFALTLAMSSVVLVTSCSTDHGAYAPTHADVNNLENTAVFVALDKRVQDSVTCVDVQEMRLPDGRLQVLANLRNKLNRRIQVQVDCVFKDGQYFVVEDTPSSNTFLDENAMEGVKFVSLNDKAQHYTIRVREAR